MKKQYYIQYIKNQTTKLQLFLVCLVWLFSSMIALQAQQPSYAKSFSLDGSMVGMNCIARDYINLEPGFACTPVSGSQFSGVIDGTQIYNVSYQSSQVSSGRTIDKTLPVGSIPGEFNVTPTGAATYAIPIEIPPGTNGMQPSVALSYSSQAGNGLLGMGFNLAGLSAISRTGHTIYHDGYAQGVNMDTDDNFSLDGQRLISVSGSGGAQQYRTEVESYSVIQAIDNNSNGIPDYFKVFTKDGKVIEYGNRANARTLWADWNPVTWYITKVTDANGNYMEYYYKEYETDEIYLEEIKYTGTSGFQPYNSIKFFYEERTADVQTTYLKGDLMTQSLLLRKIETFCEDKMVKRYKFSYHSNPADNDIYTYLKEVTLENGNGKTVNTTAFRWNKNNETWSLSAQPDLIWGDNSRNKSLYTGDINGDGISDVISVNKVEGANDVGDMIMHCFLESYSSSEYNSDHTPFNFSRTYYGYIGTNYQTNIRAEQVQDILIFDVNGDGKDEICTVIPSAESGSYPKTTINFVDLQIEFEEEYSKNPPFILNGDFNGDGKSDLICLSNDNSNSKFSYSMLTDVNNDFIHYTVNYINSLTSTTESFQRVLAIDFNNDGLTDLMTFDKTGYNLYYNNATYYNVGKYWQYFSQTPNLHGTQINFNILGNGFSKIYPGDYNGDGLTDLLCYQVTGKNTDKWVLAINKQNGFTFSELTCFPDDIYDDQDTKKDDDKDYCYVVDINKDGKQDVIIYDAKYSWANANYKNFSKVCKYKFISNGNNFVQLGSTEENTTDEHSCLANLKTIGDFNGDGSADLLYYNDGNSNYYCYSSYNTKGQHMLSKIIDGMNNITSVSYDLLTTGDPLYTESATSPEYPYVPVNAPVTVVKSITSPDGNTLSYTYKDAVAHYQGKGFLGFKEFSVTSDATNTTTTTVFQHSFDEGTNNYCLVMPKSLKITVGSTDVSEKVNTYTIAEIDASKKRIFPFVNLAVENDKLRQTKTESQNSYDASHGNLTSNTTTCYNNSTYIAKITKTYTDYADVIDFEGDLNNYYNAPHRENIYKYHKDQSGNTYQRNSMEYYTNGQIKNHTLFLDYVSKCSYKYDYWTYGNLKKVTISADGLDDRTTSYNYDSKYRLQTRVTDALNNYTLSGYNYGTGDILSGTDIFGNETTYSYDRFGRISEIKSPTGATSKTVIEWPVDDPLINAYYAEKTYVNGNLSGTVYFDKLGREVQTTSLSATGTNMSVRKKYNSIGQLEGVSKPFCLVPGDNEYTEYEYDEFGRVKKVYIDEELTYEYDYKAEGNPRSVRKTIKNVSPEQFTQKTTDATGNITSAKDNGGEIVYKYHKNWKVREITAPGSTITIDYDTYERQKKLIDPDAGTITYSYNGLDELISQTDNDGNTATMAYDKLGRIVTKNVTGEGTTQYDYYTSGNGRAMLKKVTAPNDMYDSYQYDIYGNIITKTSFIETGKEFTTSYQYDNLNRKIKETFPTGFAVINEYDSYGYLSRVRRVDNGNTIWQSGSMDVYGRWEYYTLGNNQLRVEKEFDANDMLKTIETKRISDYALVQSLEYLFDKETGNLTWRKDHMHQVSGNSLVENFQYDELNRLTGFRVNQGEWKNITYSNSNTGRITSKETVSSNFIYDGTQPHAVTGLTDVCVDVPDNNQVITYTSFNKVKTIEDNFSEYSYNATFHYGPMNNRKKAVYSNTIDGEVWYYNGDYEEKVSLRSGGVKQLHYISGGDGLAAIYVMDNGISALYFVLKDHLGSLQIITDENGNKVEELSFDPWGRRRNPSNWSYTNPSTSLICNRGFTGHEHLDQHNLINMNGRVYDPFLGMFLSPDNYVQMPDFTQNFNRYAYCLNNPLVYTDPDGEFIFTVLALLIPGGQAFLPLAVSMDTRGVINLLSNAGNIDNFNEGLAAYGAGAANGALTYINPIWGSALGEAIQQGTNNIIMQTGNEISLNEVNWGKVGNRSLYGFGGGLAAGAYSQYRGIGITIGETRIQTTPRNVYRPHRHIINHFVRSTAYHVGGNLFTGKAPFKDFDRHSIGLNSSLAIPIMMDAFVYYANKSNWGAKYLSSEISEARENQIAELTKGGEYILEKSELINGTYEVDANFTLNGDFYVQGAQDIFYYGTIPNVNGPGRMRSDGLGLLSLTRVSKFNFRFLQTAFYK